MGMWNKVWSTVKWAIILWKIFLSTQSPLHYMWYIKYIGIGAKKIHRPLHLSPLQIIVMKIYDLSIFEC